MLLATFPCASMISTPSDHWRVTPQGARYLLEHVFAPGDVDVRGQGNVLTNIAFLLGLASDEIEPSAFEHNDPAYPLIVTARAVKAERPSLSPSPSIRRTRQSSAILMYHRVANARHDAYRITVTPEVLRSHLEHLTSRYEVVPLDVIVDQCHAGELTDDTLALTFDDAYADNLAHVAPLLSEYGIPATFYATTEPLATAGPFWWDVLAQALLAGEPVAQQLLLRIEARDRLFDIHDAAARRNVHRELYSLLRTSGPAVRDHVLRQLSPLTRQVTSTRCSIL